jgi:drug/metabolite transporter (DMT)-like permease
MTNTFLYIATLAIWGTAFYAISLQLGTVPVEWSIVYRFGFGALVFFAFAAATKRKIRFSARDHLAFAAMGVFLFGLQYVVLYKATELIASGPAAVAFSSIVFFNIAFGAVFLKTPLERKIVAGAILGVAGIVMVFWNDLRGFGAGNIAIAGLALAIFSGALASVGNLISERIQDRGVPVIQTNAYGMAYGAIFCAGLALAIGEPIAFEPTLLYAGSLIYLAGIATVFGFAFYLTLIGRIGAARTGYMWVMIPIVALAVSTVLEGYLWTPIAAGGIAAVLIGNALMLTPRRARSP